MPAIVTNAAFQSAFIDTILNLRSKLRGWTDTFKYAGDDLFSFGCHSHNAVMAVRLLYEILKLTIPAIHIFTETNTLYGVLQSSADLILAAK